MSLRQRLCQSVPSARSISTKSSVNKHRRWSATEDAKLSSLVAIGLTFREIANELPQRTLRSIEARWDKVGSAKLAPVSQRWNEQEDERLLALRSSGLPWSQISEQMPGRSIYGLTSHWRKLRYRSMDELPCALKLNAAAQTRGRHYTADEDSLIVKLNSEGLSLRSISSHLPGRTARSVASRWIEYLLTRTTKSPTYRSKHHDHVASSRGREWSPDEVATLLAMKRKGETLLSVSLELQRFRESVVDVYLQCIKDGKGVEECPSVRLGRIPGRGVRSHYSQDVVRQVMSLKGTEGPTLTISLIAKFMPPLNVDQLKQFHKRTWRSAMLKAGHDVRPIAPSSRSFSTSSRSPKQRRRKYFSPEEDIKILQLRSEGYNWTATASHLPGRTPRSVHVRYARYLRSPDGVISTPLTPAASEKSRAGVSRTPYTKEDDKLLRGMKEAGKTLPTIAKQLGRTVRSIHDRLQYLRPTAEKSKKTKLTKVGRRWPRNFSEEDASSVVRMRLQFGMKWREIAERFPGRSVKTLSMRYHDDWLEKYRVVDVGARSTTEEDDEQNATQQHHIATTTQAPTGGPPG